MNSPPVGLSQNDPIEQPHYGNYRPVSIAASVSIAFGFLSLATFFSWLFVPLPLIGIALAVVALRRIKQNPSELTGTAVAWAGLVVTLACWGVGSGARVCWQKWAIPAGYTAISFERTLQPGDDERGRIIPETVYELDGERVFIRGYMYPGRQSSRIRTFTFVPSIAHCQFCSRDLRSTEMIEAVTVGDLTADFSNERIGIGGKLTIDPSQATQVFGGLPYRIDVDVIR